MMAYSDFTLTSVKERFDLQLADHPDLFGGVAPITPSDWLTAMLKETVPLARAISTEKARSEWMKLEANTITLDMQACYIDEVAKILEILVKIIAG
jgi:hypothetical protein